MLRRLGRRPATVSMSRSAPASHISRSEEPWWLRMVSDATPRHDGAAASFTF